MKKLSTSSRKLALCRETLRLLAREEAANVLGGVQREETGPTTIGHTCQDQSATTTVGHTCT
jgi:hypothetical protein